MSFDILLTELFGPYLATVVGFVFALVLLAFMMREHERQSASIAWVLAIVLVPVVGVPAYLLFAGRKLLLRARAKGRLRTVPAHPDAGLDGVAARVESIMRGYALPAASTGNRVSLITSGESTYEQIMAQIDAAEHSIHITTFGLSCDHVGRAIVERLARKAEQGVQVCLLVDALGALAARFVLLPKLERAGGQVGVFMRVLPLRRKSKANLRNHRKVAIFDARVAFAGGMNLAGQYMGPNPSRARWMDTCLKLEGPVVEDLHEVFAQDWEFATGEPLHSRRERAATFPQAQVIQVVPSGPDVEFDVLYDAIVAAVYQSQRRLWIVTPYFVPDDGLMRALLLQVRLGIDVRIILPRRSDHWVADMARARFVRRLNEAGARFYVHRARMIHAKHLLVDDAITVAGSANLDMRSLYLNYELALFCYDAHTIAATGQWMDTLLTQCEEYRPRKPNVLRRLAEDLCWLAAPLL